jgi:hypothetical protein
MLVAHQKIEQVAGSGKLFVLAPDTEMAGMIEETLSLVRRYPQVRRAIEADLDALGKARKLQRLQQKAWELRRGTAALPGLEPVAGRGLRAEELTLLEGCPRMDPEVAAVFLMARGEMGELYGKWATERLRDSRTLEAFLAQRGLRMPGARTIGDNVNAVSNATRELILDCQIAMALEEELDDFSKSTVDSTAVAANTEWPTDSGMVFKLLERAAKAGEKLALFGLPPVRPWHTVRWLKELKALHYAISVSAGKPKSEAKRRRHYRRFLKRAAKTAAHLAGEAQRLHGAYLAADLGPRRRAQAQRLWSLFGGDVADACRVMGYCEARVFQQRRTPSREKILSLADRTAALIVKGDREPLVGYRPQLARSGSGLVTALLVPEGNAADAPHLSLLAAATQRRTGVGLQQVSGDDGYTSSEGRNSLLGMHIGVVSLGGSKGRKLIPEDEWNSEAYRQARNDRSAVESLIFCLKYTYEFGRLHRRGIEAVRAELLEKVLAYNAHRILLLRERRRETAQQAA